MRRLAVIAVTVLAASTLAACEGQCEGLSISAQDREAAANGYEVEREDSWGNTCELSRDGRTWQVDD
jgi:hypothetical protein